MLSDDDDIVLEEPEIDTVEVSDENEEKMPLLKLVKMEKPSELDNILCGSLNEFYCMQCGIKTTKCDEYDRQRQVHFTVKLLCDVCNYSTPSKTHFERHRRSDIQKKTRKYTHNKEKKKNVIKKLFKCSKCNTFSAIEESAFLSHVSSCKKPNFMKNVLKCPKCDTYTTIWESAFLSHVRSCKKPNFMKNLLKCPKCDTFTTIWDSAFLSHVRSCMRYMPLHDCKEEKYIKKPLKCSKCNMFTTIVESAFLSHIESCMRYLPHHDCKEEKNIKKPLKCWKCNTFTTIEESAFLSHVKSCVRSYYKARGSQTNVENV